MLSEFIEQEYKERDPESDGILLDGTLLLLLTVGRGNFEQKIVVFLL